MIIEGDTIIWKSQTEYYEKERTGMKKNTERVLSLEEEAELIKHISELKRIQIWNPETHEGFNRTLTDMTKWNGIWIFSWK